MQVVMGVPLKGSVSPEWAFSTTALIQNAGAPIEIMCSKHYQISLARQELADSARSSGATHLFFLDGDILPQTFKNGTFQPFPQALQFMLSFRYPVVSGVYLSKKGFLPIYKYTKDENRPYKPADLKFEDVVNSMLFVDACALGCMLIDTRVFDVLERNGYFPFFDYRKDYEKGVEISEDVWFCDLLRRAGFSILLLGHVACKHEMSANLLPNGKVEYQSLGDA